MRRWEARRYEANRGEVVRLARVEWIFMHAFGGGVRQHIATPLEPPLDNISSSRLSIRNYQLWLFVPELIMVQRKDVRNPTSNR